MGISNQKLILILIIATNVAKFTPAIVPINRNSNTNFNQAIEKLHSQVQSLIDQSQLVKAEAMLDSILAFNPKSYLANYQLSLIYWQKKNCYKEAPTLDARYLFLVRKDSTDWNSRFRSYKVTREFIFYFEISTFFPTTIYTINL
jgi:hypothetical protein